MATIHGLPLSVASCSYQSGSVNLFADWLRQLPAVVEVMSELANDKSPEVRFKVAEMAALLKPANRRAAGVQSPAVSAAATMATPDKAFGSDDVTSSPAVLPPPMPVSVWADRPLLA